MLKEVSPGRFWKGETKWINNHFVLDVSVRFSINRPVRSRLVEGGIEVYVIPSFVCSKMGRGPSGRRPGSTGKFAGLSGFIM